jgi:hypothetical protein
MKLKPIVYDRMCRGHAILGSADLILRLGCFKDLRHALETRFAYSSAYNAGCCY